VPFLGNGLGIMSNGSDAISAYARTFRLDEWTETDFATTLFEGGPYLIFVWYAFRYYIILQTTRRFLFGVSRSLSLPAAFCQAFVILVGMTGTLAIQPPVAIWWWLGVGLSTTLWWRSIHPIGPMPDEGGGLGGGGGRHGPAPVTPSGRASRAPSPAAPLPGSPTPRPIRGRSAYAERLHDDK
jgi:hypothetical protein